MTVEQPTKYLQVDQYTIYAWARKGEIPAFKVGRFWRFRKEEIDKWLEGRKNERANAPSLGLTLRQDGEE